jgi:hypothetical protein
MEKVVRLGQDKNVVGILSEGVKDGTGNGKTGVIILNSGLVHRVGPNRIYVKLARQLALQGIGVLRFDFSGVGDSSHRKDNLPFAKSATEEVGFAMDFLSENRIATEFILMGICSGANISFRAAYEDARVVGAVPINFQPPPTQLGQALKDSAFYTETAATNLTSWIRFFSGKSNYRDIWKAIVTRMRIGALGKAIYHPDHETIENVSWLATVLRNFRERRLRLLMIGSGGETGDLYLRQMVRSDINALMDEGLLQIKAIAEADHLFTQLRTQQRLFEIILEWIDEFPNGDTLRNNEHRRI